MCQPCHLTISSQEKVARILARSALCTVDRLKIVTPLLISLLQPSQDERRLGACILPHIQDRCVLSRHTPDGESLLPPNLPRSCLLPLLDSHHIRSIHAE